MLHMYMYMYMYLVNSVEKFQVHVYLLEMNT